MHVNRHGSIRPYTVSLFKAHTYWYIFDCIKQSKNFVTINKYKYQEMRHMLNYKVAECMIRSSQLR